MSRKIYNLINLPNASIIKLDDGFLCLAKDWNLDAYIFKVNNNFEIISSPAKLARCDDPTFLTPNLIFGNTIWRRDADFRLMFFKLDYKNPIRTFDTKPIFYFKERWKEKNWSPFLFENEIYFVYMVCPFIVLKLDKQQTRPVKDSPPQEWAGFEIRNGTRAIPYNENEYIVPCHHVKIFEKAGENGKDIRYYHIGAYTFSRKKPFRIMRVTKEPILDINEVEGATRECWWLSVKSKILFERGIEIVGDDIFISFGEQDMRSKVLKISRMEMEKLLVDYKEVHEWTYKVT